MTVGNLLDIMAIQPDNKVVLRDTNYPQTETVLENYMRGWTTFVTGYKEFSDREIFGVHVVGKKIFISMA